MSKNNYINGVLQVFQLPFIKKLYVQKINNTFFFLFSESQLTISKLFLDINDKRFHSWTPHHSDLCSSHFIFNHNNCLFF